MAGLAAVTVALVAAAAVTLALWPDGGDTPPVGEGSPAVDGFEVRTYDDPGEQQHVDEVEAVLAGSAADPASAVLSETLARVGDPDQAIPPGTMFTVDRSTWQRTGTVASVMVAALPPGDNTATVFLVVLVDDDGWKVSQTYPQPTEGGS